MASMHAVLTNIIVLIFIPTYVLNKVAIATYIHVHVFM